MIFDFIGFFSYADPAPESESEMFTRFVIYGTNSPAILVRSGAGKVSFFGRLYPNHQNDGWRSGTMPLQSPDLVAAAGPGGSGWVSPSGNLRLGMDGGRALGFGDRPVGPTVTPRAWLPRWGSEAPDAEPLRIHQLT